MIRLELEDWTEHVRTLRLPVPMRESKSLLKLLQMDLEAHPPQAATVALSLALKPAPPRTTQSGIFLPTTPAPDKLELTLARIRGLVGENNVGVPELLDTHHPHPFRLVSGSRKSTANRLSQAIRPSGISARLSPQSSNWNATAPSRIRRFGHSRKSTDRRWTMANFRRLVDSYILESRRMGHHAFERRALSDLSRTGPALVHRRRV